MTVYTLNNASSVQAQSVVGITGIYLHELPHEGWLCPRIVGAGRRGGREYDKLIIGGMVVEKEKL